MEIRKSVLVLTAVALLAAPAFAARVQVSGLLPPLASPQFVKTDATGNIYVGGNIFTLVPQPATGGVFLAKISADGTKLLYFSSGPSVTFQLGFVAAVSFGAFAIEADGSAYVSCSFYFGPFGAPSSSSIYKVDPAGGEWQLMKYFTSISDMTLDTYGNVYVTGFDSQVVSTPGSLSGANQSNQFVEKLDPTLTTVVYAIHNYGGSHIAVDAQGNVFTVASDPFGVTTTPGAYQTVTVSPIRPAQYVTAISADGTHLLFATYLTSESGQDAPAGIAIDSAGNVYIAGSTQSRDYPVTLGALETEFPALQPDPTGAPTTGYVSVLNPTGTALVFSTFFGGSDFDTVTSISLDERNQLIYLAGAATSPDLPGIFGVQRHCVPQSFVARITMDGKSVSRTQTVTTSIYASYFSTYLFLPNLALGPNGVVWIDNRDSLSRVDLESPDTPIACLADSAGTVVTSSVAPGQLLTIFGDQLSTATSAPQPSNGTYPSSGTSASVTINGTPAPILYESPHQLNIQVPFELAGLTTATIRISNTAATGPDTPIDSITLPVVAKALSIFETSADSAGCVPTYPEQLVTLALNPDGTVNGCGNPAKAGSTVTIFMNGFGVTSPAQATGSVVSAAAPLGQSLSLCGGCSYTFPAFISAASLAGAISGVFAVQISIPDSRTYAPIDILGNIQIQVVP